jgi:hypothetical protein
MAGQVQRVAGFLSSTGITCPDPAIVCAAPQVQSIGRRYSDNVE